MKRLHFYDKVYLIRYQYLNTRCNLRPIIYIFAIRHILQDAIDSVLRDLNLIYSDLAYMLGILKYQNLKHNQRCLNNAKGRFFGSCKGSRSKCLKCKELVGK